MFVHDLRRSAAGPTLDTGGWLALTRPGLSPGKRRRALLGATTLRLARRPLPRRKRSDGAAAGGRAEPR